ncbi:hypothetical protein KUTeg_022474 [Tegillarca granosa]|uniref:Selenoprotein F n=1 Tax=Tegillarca granosa TaxID=220873 RepID=A0ABQ9EBS4_TEGGR|nr:hypothetical protein KUTeg_022474 [Tegillarca granosa]
MGFSPNLMCSSCNELDQYNLSKLTESCKGCCHQDSDDDQALKSDRVKQFPGLAVRYVRGADPIIKLMDDNRNVVETLGIDKWNTDSVEEFFHERLKK